MMAKAKKGKKGGKGGGGGGDAAVEEIVVKKVYIRFKPSPTWCACAQGRLVRICVR